MQRRRAVVVSPIDMAPASQQNHRSLLQIK